MFRDSSEKKSMCACVNAAVVVTEWNQGDLNKIEI